MAEQDNSEETKEVSQENQDKKDIEVNVDSIEYLNESLSHLSGIEKSAILLISLDKQGVSLILKNLEPRYVQQISLCMANLIDLKKSVSIKVFKLFLKKIKEFSSVTAPTIEFLRESLISALGHEKAEGIIEQISKGRGSKGLDAMRWMSSSEVFSLIRNEHPQIQSIVLSYLEPSHAASVFELLNEKEQLDIILRISCLGNVNKLAMDELNFLMQEKASAIKVSDSSAFSGSKAAASIMNNVSTALENKLLSWIKETDEELHAKISDLMFVFESFLDVSESSMQRLLRDVENDVLVKALKGSSSKLQDKIFNCISKKAAEAISYDLSLLGPIKISDVEQSQKKIIALAKKLEDQDLINLSLENSSEYIN